MTDTQTLIDTGWVLLCSALVFVMQAGFCCLETGLVRAKNSINVAMKNLVDFGLSSMAFGLFGFMVAFGVSWNGLFGVSRPALETPQELTFFLFQLMFCGTTTTIVSGAIAERMRFSGYLVVASLISLLIYPVSTHWVWGGVSLGSSTGWLAQSGFVDFAGSTVVHLVGGTVALVACIIIGPRTGRFEPRWAENTHNIPIATLGVLILWFGWYGFNGGSTLGLTDAVPRVMVNTTLSAVGGLMAALLLSWIVSGRPVVGDVMNGALAGLVSITASCHAVDVLGAVCIGTIGGLLSTLASRALIRLRIDDAIGAFPVHAVAGAWGTVAVAVFGSPILLGTGLGPASQMLVQLKGVGACGLWAAVAGWVLIRLAGLLVPLRVTQEEEEVGLNIVEHGAHTELNDLLGQMEEHRSTGDLSKPLRIESESEVGQVAAQYNRVLQSINAQQQLLSQSHQEIEARNAELQSAQATLQQQVEELECFNRTAVERELRMMELKSEINELITSDGGRARY